MNKGLTKSGAERRTSPRLPPSALACPISVSLNSLPELALVNISRGGALLQSRELLRPNAKIVLRIAIDGVIHKVRGRILRSNIAGLQGGVQYHSAVVFDQEFTALGELTAAPEVQTASCALNAVLPPPDETPLSADSCQSPPEDDFVYSLEDILVPAQESKISDPAPPQTPPQDDFAYSLEQILVPAQESKISDPAPPQIPPENDLAYAPEKNLMSAPESKISDPAPPQTPPKDDFFYAPREILVPGPGKKISDPALLQALRLNRW
jgi:hypothetical protein